MIDSRAVRRLFRLGTMGSAALALGLIAPPIIALPSAQQPAPPAEEPRSGVPVDREPAAMPAARFVGIWVGTQAWAISNPPPGASQDQAVTLELQLLDGTITGTMKPFLGGEDGATIVDAAIVGEELHATAVVGRPRAQAGRRGGGAGWKDPIRIAFVFKNAGVNMTGTADVRMGDVPWMKFAYDLGKKRARY
jgi:hypothetical protein